MNQTKLALIHEMLDDPNSGIFELAHVGSMSDAEKYLAGQSVDMVLLDIGLTNPTGLEAVKRVRAAAPRVSIVLLSSADDEQIAVQAIQQGAQDYLIKGQIEPRELTRALLNAAERKIIEEIQFAEKERAQATLDSIGDAVICTDASDKITFLNRVAETMTGWSAEGCGGAADGRNDPDRGRHYSETHPGSDGEGGIAKSKGKLALELCSDQPRRKRSFH